LDVSINLPFKDAIRHQYELACSVFKSVTNQKITREALLEWIIQVCENNETISPQIVKNSFISNKLDDSEDELFNGFDKLNQGIIEQNFTTEVILLILRLVMTLKWGSSDAKLEDELQK